MRDIWCKNCDYHVYDPISESWVCEIILVAVIYVAIQLMNTKEVRKDESIYK
jgi:hypothetical protein